ncbi:hypothetical protein [Nodularia sp. UHCC 0506]|uniref:hypothetical protein n=1 Tax=Nodularia sp. UHCC 0506 TaxID=3110243 RepID=UPI002B2190CB|nr:hypothetical protein [Nodularia sp. UHCC 0506]MEA5513757.1 hypothetical protein [Nodularia sp. UHCC 0506]
MLIAESLEANWFLLNTQHSALSTQHSTLSTQHSALSTQHSALSTQHSALNTQHFAISATPVLRLLCLFEISETHGDA